MVGKVLGVLGGMGPLATADFFAKLVAMTPASRDQDHLPVVIVSDPRIPDRTAALERGDRQTVLDALLEGAARLQSSGAHAVVIPCNTAHAWAPLLRERMALPLLAITDAAVSMLTERIRPGGKVLVLGTRGTLRFDLYGVPLRLAGFVPARLHPRLNAEVAAVIEAVKAGRIAHAQARFAPLFDRIMAADAPPDAILLACTELPVAAGGLIAVRSELIDATAALARACIRWATDAATKEGSPCVPC